MSSGVGLTKFGSGLVGKVGSGNLPVVPKFRLGAVVEGKELKMLSSLALFPGF